MPSSRTLAIVGFIVASCKQQPVVTRDTTKPVPPASASVAAPTSKRALEGYPSPIDSSASGCKLSGQWETEQPRALRFRPSSPPFLTLHGAKRAEVTLLEEADPIAFVELSSDVVRAFGFLSGEVGLHPAKPFLVAGYIAPASESRLVWRGSKGGKVGIEIDVGKFLEPFVAPKDDRACDDVTLSSTAKFAARDAIAEVTKTTEQLPVAHPIALRKDAKGPPIAEIHPSSCPALFVDVIERSGPDARVVVQPCSLDPMLSYVVVGWVPASLLIARAGGTGGSFAFGGGIGDISARRRGKRASCEGEVPLVAEQAGEMHLIGAIAAKTVIDLFEAGPAGYVRVLPLRGNLELGAGVRLLAKESFLAGCKVVE
jgi:hypothetical protein